MFRSRSCLPSHRRCKRTYNGHRSRHNTPAYRDILERAADLRARLHGVEEDLAIRIRAFEDGSDAAHAGLGDLPPLDATIIDAARADYRYLQTADFKTYRLRRADDGSGDDGAGSGAGGNTSGGGGDGGTAAAAPAPATTTPAGRGTWSAAPGSPTFSPLSSRRPTR
jgi:hypothetical protein